MRGTKNNDLHHYDKNVHSQLPLQFSITMIGINYYHYNFLFVFIKDMRILCLYPHYPVYVKLCEK